MNNKKTFLIVLFIAFSQATSAQAFSFNTFSHTFSQTIGSYSQSAFSWIKERNLGLPIIASAFVGFAAYIIFSSKHTYKLPENYDESSASIPVLGQQGSTCAYHALKNGLACYEINQLNKWVNEAEDQRFNDQDHWQEQHTR